MAFKIYLVIFISKNLLTLFMETIILEIRSMEGGQDAKLLVGDMTNIYEKFCNKNGIEYKVLDQRSGFVKV